MWSRGFADESVGMGCVGGVEDAGALVADDLGEAVVDVSGGVKAEPGMAMLVVVPAEEVHAVRSRGFDRGESGGEVGPVLQRLELRFAERVVIRDVGPGVGLGDAEV